MKALLSQYTNHIKTKEHSQFVIKKQTLYITKSDNIKFNTSLFNYHVKEDFMFRALCVFLIIFITMPVFASKTVVTQSPYYNGYYTPQAYYGGDYIPNRRYYRKNSSIFPDINDLERYALNRNFTKDSDRTRLERLETLAFGAVQTGDISTRYDSVREAILTRPKQNYKKSVLRNISDYFNGQMTGSTPSILPIINQNNYGYDTDYDNIYPESNFGKNFSTEYITPYGRRYHTSNYGMGTGSRIHILD